MNEGSIFIAITTATILEGISGALLVVPVLASVVVIMEQAAACAGVAAFEDDGKRFVAPPRKDKVRRPFKLSTKESQKEDL
ncbi:hypothetical protein [Candidatus Villigracilis affinis]|uniref:hypothetical protein n=1 Tax=Candidatus Villigracilis affinis TaxID=3140682 RepID=UPI002A1BB385|nr:hypothetical protein [Anaerolineales bacterium]